MDYSTRLSVTSSRSRFDKKNGTHACAPCVASRSGRRGPPSVHVEEPEEEKAMFGLQGQIIEDWYDDRRARARAARMAQRDAKLLHSTGFEDDSPTSEGS